MKQWHLWWPLKMAGFGPLLWQCPQLEQYPQLELKALMMQEGEAEVEAEVPGAAESGGVQQSVGPDGDASQPYAGREQHVWWSVFERYAQGHETPKPRW